MIVYHNDSNLVSTISLLPGTAAGIVSTAAVIQALISDIEGVPEMRSSIAHSNSENKEQELFFLISHGLMHLLGFDHQSEEEYNFVIEEQRKALRSIEYDKI